MKVGQGVDRVTVVAIAIVAYAITNLAHEGLGHGATCTLVDGALQELSAIHVSCDVEGRGAGAARWLAAGGSLANLALAAIALVLLKRGQGATGGRFFLWLLATVNLLQAAGYGLFSGIGGVGDWAQFIEGMEPTWAFRLLLTTVGILATVAVVALSLRLLLPFLGPLDGRVSRARVLTVLPYLSGGLLFVVAGLPNPHGLVLVLISAVAASFGGTSALAWMSELLSISRLFPPSVDPPLALGHSNAWLAAAAVAVAVFVGVFGPGLTF